MTFRTRWLPRTPNLGEVAATGAESGLPNAGDGEAVPAFAADRLHGGGVEARVAAEEGEAGAGGDDVGAVVVRVAYPAAADDIVDDDQAARVGHRERVLDVPRIVVFVRVDEHEVE